MRVMIVGASNDRRKFGNKAVRAHLRAGHDVLPVNPDEQTIEGLRCYPSVTAVPGALDRTLFYLPPRIGIKVIEELAQRGESGEVWFNPGAESDELIAKAHSLGFDPVLACSIVDIGERP